MYREDYLQYLECEASISSTTHQHPVVVIYRLLLTASIAQVAMKPSSSIL